MISILSERVKLCVLVVSTILVVVLFIDLSFILVIGGLYISFDKIIHGSYGTSILGYYMIFFAITQMIVFSISAFLCLTTKNPYQLICYFLYSVSCVFSIFLVIHIFKFRQEIESVIYEKFKDYNSFAHGNGALADNIIAKFKCSKDCTKINETPSTNKFCSECMSSVLKYEKKLFIASISLSIYFFISLVLFVNFMSRLLILF
ncbi:hypothetical protein HZS_7138 [Henneguya salminicola]|nr:hypothetical protein HZS_7138 [Henneguya salminicola]